MKSKTLHLLRYQLGVNGELELEELLNVRNGNSELENFTKDDVNNMIDFICSS